MKKRENTYKIVLGVVFLLGLLFLLSFIAYRIYLSRHVAVIVSEGTYSNQYKSPVLNTKNTYKSVLGKLNNNAIDKSGSFIETLPILMYHYIETPSATTTMKGLYLEPNIFENQLQTLEKNNYKTLFMSEAAKDIRTGHKLDKKNIVLTFDDGYEDFYTEAFPLLKKYNMKGTVYVIINGLDKKGYLTKAQVKEMAASGVVEIGSHTFNHPDLRILKKKDAKFEIQASKKILEQISGKPIYTFAYPFGYYKPEFFSELSEAGYEAAVTVKPGSKQSFNEIWLLTRLRPDNREGEVFINWIKRWEK